MNRFAAVAFLAWTLLVAAEEDVVTVTYTSTHYLPWKPMATAANGNCYCIVGESRGMHLFNTFFL